MKKLHLTGIVLAAGQGTRMKSALPKVLHPVCGRPLVYYPMKAAFEALCSEVIVVLGHGKDQVEKSLLALFPEEADGVRFKIAEQKEQRGTGDAAKSALSSLSHEAEEVMVYYGDVPLLRGEDLARVRDAHRSVKEKDSDFVLTMATSLVANPFGYGRILRNAEGMVCGIREQKDLKEGEEAIHEINPGVYLCSASFLKEALENLKPNNAQGEYYLTDIVAYAISKNKKVHTVLLDAENMEGVNDRQQLHLAEAILQARILAEHRRNGVSIGHGVSVEEGVRIARDVRLENHVVLRGQTVIEENAVLDIGSVLTNVHVGPRVRIKPYTVATDSVLSEAAEIGPFSHLRPGTHVGEEAHVGNFVELKKTRLGKKSKANHLAYLGDGLVGERVNVSAGVIFCNYDGVNKHVTQIEDDAFIGTDSQLVAPVRIGKGAYVATGTCVTHDVPDDALAIGRTKQDNKEGYASKLRARQRAVAKKT